MVPLGLLVFVTALFLEEEVFVVSEDSDTARKRESERERE